MGIRPNYDIGRALPLSSVAPCHFMPTIPLPPLCCGCRAISGQSLKQQGSEQGELLVSTRTALVGHGEIPRGNRQVPLVAQGPRQAINDACHGQSSSLN